MIDKQEEHSVKLLSGNFNIYLKSQSQSHRNCCIIWKSDLLDIQIQGYDGHLHFEIRTTHSRQFLQTWFTIDTNTNWTDQY